MHLVRRVKSPAPSSSIGLIIVAFLMMGIASCSSSYRPTRRTETNLDPGWPRGNDFFHQASYGRLQVAAPKVPGAEFVNDDELCLTCHEAYTKAFENNVHRGDSCESCHGPASRHLETRGKEPGLILNFKTLPAPRKSELCLKCHEENRCAAGARWRYSKHAHCGVACTDCHTSHYDVPAGTPATTEPGETASQPPGPPVTLVRGQEPAPLPSLLGSSNNLGAVAPYVCYRCHSDMAGVACTDCHNPHPNTTVPRVVNVSHTNVQRPKRLQMSVGEPQVCYKCHPKIYGMNALPSHHPIKEGKMVCSDCHDGHGQGEGNLKADRVNDVCWKCHADKQGPFVYEHPPVTKNCATCHEPHGTVANNLLRQPATFLCLRCHTGHLHHHGGTGSTGSDIDGNLDNSRGFYTNCTICHTQIHGSDTPGPVRHHDFMR